MRCNKPIMKGLRVLSSPKRESNDIKNSLVEKTIKDVTQQQQLMSAGLKVTCFLLINISQGLEVICKLMKDKHLRQEAAKKTPQLYDEMLIYMIEHVNISAPSK